MTTRSKKTAPPVPRTDSGLCDWFHAFASTIEDDPAAACVTDEAATELITLAREYDIALGVANTPETRTAEAIARKDAARDRALAVFRSLAARIRADFRVSGQVKLALGIRPKAAGPRPRIPAPETAPVLLLDAAGPGVHVMRYCDSADPDSRRKPGGVQQLQLFRHIGREPIDDPEQAAYLTAVTRSPFTIECPDEYNGHIATYFGRWSTRTALVGPWSAPLAITVIGR